ncbi:MAG: diguanylate cyclase [Desulfovibrionaceae bacterium]
MMENALFESHFDLIPFGIYVVDVQSFALVYSNRAFREHFGDHRGALCHKALFERDTPCPWCRLDTLLPPEARPTDQTIVFEHFNEVDDRWYQMQVRAMTWPDGRTVKYSIAVDISELKETQNRLAEAHAMLALRNLDLRRLSTTDPLTSLANRQHIESLIRQALDARAGSAAPLSLILFDIDHFKAINDRFGHLAGDAVLRTLAAQVRQTVPSDCAIGRWGGEEFLILCPGTDRQGAARLAETVRLAVREVALPDSSGLSCSFGLTEAGRGESLDDLLARVDKALYAAKDRGRDRVELA